MSNKHKRLRLVFTAFLSLLSLARISAAAEYTPPSADQTLLTLESQHPRLILTPQRVSELKQIIAEDQVASDVYRSVMQDADEMLDQPPFIHELRDGRRLLYVSSDVLHRVETLAFAFRMTDERKYADRAWVELEAVANFKDWNPAHFLDTAVMTHACAIGYDWLFSQWTDQQRKILREAIVEKGLTAKRSQSLIRRSRENFPNSLRSAPASGASPPTPAISQPSALAQQAARKPTGPIEVEN